MPPSPDAQRTDAVRNRERLLAAAETEFAEHGPAASVSAIAQRAGIAKGTVFRHFATKDDLMVAIVSVHLTALSDSARRLADADDPGAALLEFLTVAGDRRRQHDVDYLWAASGDDPRVAALRDELHAAIESLVERARSAGTLRADITAADVFLLMCAPIHITENLTHPTPELWRRYLAIIFDGLRVEGASPLPESAPSLS